eukprot:4393067-Pyramimonas_sp.AAC.1
MKKHITSLAALIKASRYAGKEGPIAAGEIAVYKSMVAQMEPLDKQSAGVKIMIERKAARAAEVQKRMTELQEEADTLLYDAESLKQTLGQLTQEKETEKDAGMGEAPSPPIGARPTMVGPASMPSSSAAASAAPMQPVLSA